VGVAFFYFIFFMQVDRNYIQKYKNKINVKKYQHILKKCGRESLVRFL